MTKWFHVFLIKCFWQIIFPLCPNLTANTRNTDVWKWFLLYLFKIWDGDFAILWIVNDLFSNGILLLLLLFAPTPNPSEDASIDKLYIALTGRPAASDIITCSCAFQCKKTNDQSATTWKCQKACWRQSKFEEKNFMLKMDDDDWIWEYKNSHSWCRKTKWHKLRLRLIVSIIRGGSIYCVLN